MDGSYTCLRCLSALTKRTITHSKSSRSAWRGAYRAVSTNASPCANNPRIPAQRAPILTNKPLSTRRGVANAATQAPDLSAQQQIPVPPGPQYNKAPEHTWGRVLRPDRLFNPFSESPITAIRHRAAYTKQNAYCPHPDHQRTRVPISPDDSEARKPQDATLPPAHVHFECPDCGIPVYCSEEHWADDYENHLEICDTLRQINEDDHDLQSGRYFPEFNYPGPQIDEILVNMTNWDTLLYTREFEAINDERSMRQATRLLTYPLTIGSVLHELSPYNIRNGGRLTVEGLKSLTG